MVTAMRGKAAIRIRWVKGTGYGMVPFIRRRKPSGLQLLLGVQFADIDAYDRVCLFS